MSPYLGYESLRPAHRPRGRRPAAGVFVLALTSNPEGAAVQHAVPATVESSPASDRRAARRADNAAAREPAASSGSVGLVVGATVGTRGAATSGSTSSAGRRPVLAPGFGAQGGTAEDLRATFGAAWPRCWPRSSREVLAAGPDAAPLRDRRARGRRRAARLRRRLSRDRLRSRPRRPAADRAAPDAAGPPRCGGRAPDCARFGGRTDRTCLDDGQPSALHRTTARRL